MGDLLYLFGQVLAVTLGVTIGVSAAILMLLGVLRLGQQAAEEGDTEENPIHKWTGPN